MNKESGLILLVTAGVAWLTAQSAKMVLRWRQRARQGEKHSLRAAARDFARSGGMPSGHSATMASTTTYIGLVAGVDSLIFALALVTSIIVMYDATHVRYAVGEIGERLNDLLTKEQRLKVVEGHTLPQVVVGALIGVAIGVAAYFLVG